MVRASLHRLTALLLLATYSVASIAGGLLHHHHDHAEGHHHGEHCQHDHASVHGHGLADHDAHDFNHGDCEHAGEATAAYSNTGHSLFDDDCSACRFISQRTLATSPVSPNDLCTHSVELSLRHPSQHPVSPILARHSRAPPAVG
jgi:hypothetical protein